MRCDNEVLTLISSLPIAHQIKMIRFHSGKPFELRFRQQLLAVRRLHNQAAAPIKSYRGITDPIRLFWHHKVSNTSKYFSYMLSLAFVLTHYHPNTLITVGPPLALAGWLGYKNWFKYNMNQVMDSVKPVDLADAGNDGKKINIEKYDENSIENVINNVDSELDNFKVQILQLVERRIMDYIVEMKGRGSTDEQKFSTFIDANDQFNINLAQSNIETFITTKVELPQYKDQDLIPDYIITNLIKLSLPVYSMKDLSADKRLAVVEVALLEIPTEKTSNYQQFRIRIEIKPYGFTNRESHIVIDEMDGIYDSDKLTRKKDLTEYEEITIDTADKSLTTDKQSTDKK